jgi:hypothetical protein
MIVRKYAECLRRPGPAGRCGGVFESDGYGAGLLGYCEIKVCRSPPPPGDLRLIGYNIGQHHRRLGEGAWQRIAAGPLDRCYISFDNCNNNSKKFYQLSAKLGEGGGI